jgi:16S rRNA processing protein RimM
LIDKFIIVGNFGKVHGVAGDIRLHSTTDFPEVYLKTGSFFLGKKGQYTPIEVKIIRFYKSETWLVRPTDYNRETVQSLTGLQLCLPIERRVKPRQGKFYIEDLPGMLVVDAEGIEAGEVVQAEKGPVNDLLYIQFLVGKTVVIPFIKQFIDSVDTKNCKILLKKTAAELIEVESDHTDKPSQPSQPSQQSESIQDGQTTGIPQKP